MAAHDTEHELESFREQWRKEVSTRHKRAPTRSQSEVAKSSQIAKLPNAVSPTIQQTHSQQNETLEHVLHSYHDLPNEEDQLRLNSDERSSNLHKEPSSALEHYERAVERETQGNLGDSLSHYRKAFKLDSAVQEKYRMKHFPSAPPVKTESRLPINTASTELREGAPATLSELLDDFATLSIASAPPETNLSPPPPCPIAHLPEELLSQILEFAGVNDVPSFSRLAQTSKRMAYLVMTEDSLWKTVTMDSIFGITCMIYRYCCDLQGRPLNVPTAPAILDLSPAVYPTQRSQFRHRPRIRFGGCYISTVNYARPGGASQSRFTWNNPVHIVTYYRYLRFFRNGTCISLLTTAEPADTVHHLVEENLHKQHSGALPSAVMKDALRGRWRLSGAARDVELDKADEGAGPGQYSMEPNSLESDEQEGDLHVETDGVVSKYQWKMQFSITSAGRKDGTRNNRLAWKGFWSYNRLTDDWGEFGLKNDRPL